jgi:integrase
MANHNADGTLTVGFCDTAKPRGDKKQDKFSDGRGLYLRVSLGKRGQVRRSWIWIGELNGTEQRLGLGRYTPGYASSNGLKAARLKAQEYSTMKGAGISPLQARRDEQRAVALAERGNVTFRTAINEYLDLQQARWRSKATALDWRTSFGRTADALVGTPQGKLGDMAIKNIKPEHVAEALKDSWHDNVRGVRLRRRLDEFFRWAIVRAYTTTNAASLDHIQAQLGRRSKHRPVHFKALPHAQVGDFMSELRSRRGDDMAGAALEFMLLTVVRTRQVALARWSEIDLDQALWVSPGENTKNGEDLEVPLSSAAVALLRSLPGERRPDDLIFPGAGGGMLGRNSIRRFAQDKMGRGKAISAHGFRSCFRDFVAEERPVDENGRPYPQEAAEAALHHAGGNATELAYKRTQYLRIRRGLMEAWSAYLSTPSQPLAKVKPRLVAVA